MNNAIAKFMIKARITAGPAILVAGAIKLNIVAPIVEPIPSIIVSNKLIL